MGTELTESTGVNNPLALLKAMIDKGADPDVMGKMLDLAERWEANQARKAYQLAMNACQAEMPTVIRNRQNDRTKRLYSPLETVQFTAKPIYTKHGFSISFAEGESHLADHTRVIMFVMHKGGHTETLHGDYPWDGRGAKGGEVMNAIQGHVSTNSYAQRDMIRKAFNITIADADNDGNSSNGAALEAEEMAAINERMDRYIKSRKLNDAQAEDWTARILKWMASTANLDNIDRLDQLPRSSFVTIKNQLDDLIKKATVKK